MKLKNTFKQLLYSLALLCLWGYPLSLLQAQEAVLRLLDKQTLEPLSFAHYMYGDQGGASDQQGLIRFSYQTGTVLLIQHLSYGRQAFDDEKVQQGLTDGWISVSPDAGLPLQPVTIIAMHPSHKVKQEKPLGARHHLSHDAGQVLQNVSFIAGIRKSGSYGFDPVMRGFKHDQLNIVVDGALSATAACPNRMDPPSSQISPNMTQHIELLKGPYALRYGTGFGGTINFVGADPAFVPGFKPIGRLSAGYENNGEVFTTEAVLGFVNAFMNFQLYGALAQGNNYTDGTGEHIAASFARNSFGTKTAVRLSKNQWMELSAARNYADDVDFPSLPMDLRTDETWMLQLRHQAGFTHSSIKNLKTNLYGSWVDHFMDNRLKPLDPRMLEAETRAYTRNYGGRTEVEIQHGMQQLFAGADIRVEEAEGLRRREFLMGPNAGKILNDDAWQHGRISKSGLFAEYRYAFHDYLLVAAARLELNHAEVFDAAPEFTAVYPETTQMQLNPSFSAGITRYWGEGFSASAWAGRAQRSGSLGERFINYFPVGLDPYEMLGNPGLKAEINNQADLHLNHQSRQSQIGITVYIAYLQDYISSKVDTSLQVRLPSSPGVRQYTNLDRAMLTGFEFSLSQKLPARLESELSMAYTYGQDMETRTPLPEIPPLELRFRLNGKYFAEKLMPDVQVRHVLRQDRIAAELAETATPAFTLVDVGLSYAFSNQIKLDAGVNNLFDVVYYEHLSRALRTDPAKPLYARGRSVFVRLNVDLM